MRSGQYCHFGLSESIEAPLRNVPVPVPVRLHVNVDGLPLTKSTRDQFWPILCRAGNCEGSKPFSIGIYYGQCKALDHNAFLQQFVSDLKVALQQGELGKNIISHSAPVNLCILPSMTDIFMLGANAFAAENSTSCLKRGAEGEAPKC